MDTNWSEHIKETIEFHKDTINSYTRSGDFDDVEMLLATILLDIGKYETGFDGDVVATDSRGKEFEIYWEQRDQRGTLFVKLEPFSVTDQDHLDNFMRAMKVI